MPNTPLQESPTVVEDSDEEKILNDLQECNKEKGSLRIAASEKGLYVGGLVFSQDSAEMSSIGAAIDRRISEGRLAGLMAF
ncbi:hypothetical protein Tco_0455269 [Tanacetum coccineum]